MATLTFSDLFQWIAEKKNHLQSNNNSGTLLQDHLFRNCLVQSMYSYFTKQQFPAKQFDMLQRYLHCSADSNKATNNPTIRSTTASPPLVIFPLGSSTSSHVQLCFGCGKTLQQQQPQQQQNPSKKFQSCMSCPKCQHVVFCSSDCYHRASYTKTHSDQDCLVLKQARLPKTQKIWLIRTNMMTIELQSIRTVLNEQLSPTVLSRTQEDLVLLYKWLQQHEPQCALICVDQHNTAHVFDSIVPPVLLPPRVQPQQQQRQGQQPMSLDDSPLVATTLTTTISSPRPPSLDVTSTRTTTSPIPSTSTSSSIETTILSASSWRQCSVCSLHTYSVDHIPHSSVCRQTACQFKKTLEKTTYFPAISEHM